MDLHIDTSVMPIVIFRFPSRHFTDSCIKANYVYEKFHFSKQKAKAHSTVTLKFALVEHMDLKKPSNSFHRK